MRFSLLTTVAVVIGSSIAQNVLVHVVRVSSTGGSLTYTPNNLVAATGDMVQFQFGLGNHTITQSAFETPCQPLGTSDQIYSGYMPVAQTATSVPTYSIMVKDQNPMWLFCSQGKHCSAGMVMVINEPKTDTTKTLAAYQAAAKTATTVQVGGLTNAGTNNGGGSVAAPSATPATGTTGSATAQQAGAASPQVTAGAEKLAVGDILKLGGAFMFTVLFLI